MHALLAPHGASPAQAVDECSRYLAGRVRRWRVARALLPGSARESLLGLLAWGALVREVADGANPEPGLGALVSELERALEGRARGAAGIALSLAVRRHGLPAELLREPLVEHRRALHVSAFETRQALLQHARAVAAPDGRLLLRVLDAGGARNETLGDALAIALQLSAWTGCVRRDFERGRLRLPMDELLRNHASLDALRAGRDDAGVRRTLAEHTGWIRGFYAKGWDLCRELGPWRGRLLAFVLRWNAAGLSALEARAFDVRRGAPPAGWFRLLACAGTSAAHVGPPRLA